MGTGVQAQDRATIGQSSKGAPFTWNIWELHNTITLPVSGQGPKQDGGFFKTGNKSLIQEPESEPQVKPDRLFQDFHFVCTGATINIRNSIRTVYSLELDF